MRERFKMIVALASLAMVAGVIRCLWLWQPERQLLLHQQHLIEAAQDRDWSRVEAAIDPAYSDRWGYKRETLIRDGREWLRQFFALTISTRGVEAHLTPAGGTVKERLVFDGTGTALAQMAQQRVNELPAPCTFEWRRQGWKPWVWTLVRMDNSELELRAPPEM